MIPTEAVALRLRFGEHRCSDEPPDLAAFTRAPAAATGARLGRAPEPCRVLPGRRPQPAAAPMLLFFQHASYGIPAPGDGSLPALDVSSWSLRPTVFGYLAAVPRRPAPSRARALWVMAACLPLALPLTASAAAPGKDKPAVQRPVKEPAVPAAPGTEDEASDEDGAGPAPVPDAEPDPSLEPPEDPEPETDIAATPPPPPVPTDSAGPLSERATLDAAWEGVDGFQVELELKGGRQMRGYVGAVQRETFTLIQAETGAVLVLPKSGVASLRAYVPPPVPTKSGTGLLVGGGIFTGTGAPVFVAGVSILGLCPSCTSIHLPLLLVGGAALGAGIPMLVRGTKHRQAYQRAIQERSVSPMVMRTREGWTGGVRFRF